MNPRFVGLGLVLLTALLYGAFRSWWAGPVAEARADLAAYRDRLQKADAEVRRGAQAGKALDELRSRSLGGDEETVDHRVRTQLNRLLESLEVSEATVTTSEPRTVETPARSVMGRAQASLRKRRDEPDFATLEFKIGGVAPVGRVLGLLTELRAQTWPCRVEDVRLGPVANGAQLRFAVRCTTMFLLGPDAGEPAPSNASAEELAQFADFARSNPFALPPSPVVAVQPSSSKPSRPTPPSFPYDKWRLTGIAELAGTMESWWVRPNGKTVVLREGAGIGKALIAGIDPEAVVLQRADQQLRVEIGGVIPR